MKSVKLSALVWALLLLTSPSLVRAQREGVAGAKAATDPWSGSRYCMTNVVGDIPENKITGFSLESNGATVSEFSVRVEWNSSKMSLADWEPTWFLENNLGIDTFTVSQSAGSIVLHFWVDNPEELICGGYLIDFYWSTPCQADGQEIYLSMPNPHADNVFYLPGHGIYRPASITNGWVELKEYTGDIWPVGASGAVGTNIKVPLKAVNNFDPIGGITARVIFDITKLSYQTYDTAGTWAGGGVGDITITRSKDTLLIDDDGYYSETDSIVWFYLVFRNTDNTPPHPFREVARPCVTI